MINTILPETLSPFFQQRPRRNRKSEEIRSLIRETHLLPSHLVAPLFILEGTNQSIEIKSMPGIFRHSIDLLVKECKELMELGVRSVDLFAVIDPKKKDRFGQEAYRRDNLVCQAVKTLKEKFPTLTVMVDIALDPYTDHGHDGLIDDHQNILNDETLIALGKMTLLAAEAGADVIAPSDMMDGRIAYLRHQLDTAGYSSVSLLSYTAKYASSFYGPFREALNSAPKFGDKKTYQMDPANVREALLEAALDEQEGADMLLVKPALSYLDVIAKLRQATNLPIGAYQVSGEYSMMVAAAEKGWLDFNKVLMESLLSIRRAGADFILTYGAKQAAKLLRTITFD